MILTNLPEHYRGLYHCSQEGDYIASDDFISALFDLDKAIGALKFYADPPKFDEDGDRLSIPDFYSEMDFGDRAQTVIKEIEGISNAN